MYLILIICTCLILLTILSIFAQQLKELRASVLAYGKLNLGNIEKPKTPWANALSKLIVPKHYFSHFYVIGLVTAIICWMELALWTQYNTSLLLIPLLQKWDNDNGSYHVSQQQCLIGLTLMTLHLSRRVYESFYIEKASKTATMNVSHYLIGVGFYGAMVLGTWLEGATQFNIWDSYKQQHNNNNNLITTLISVFLFVYASYHQYQCHAILATLRKNSSGYAIPRGDWFEYIVTPHYFADILVYLSLNILYQFQNYILLCGLVWTTVNLSIVSNETQAWYQTYFKEKYHQAFPKGRWRIIPGCF
jgi:3-oxo-5-alpha-steroid 4-dehydrogenase 3